MTLAELVKNAREKSGMSLQEAANVIGCTKSHLWEIEDGKSRNPTLTLIASLVIVFGIRPEAIIATAISAGDKP